MQRLDLRVGWNCGSAASTEFESPVTVGKEWDFSAWLPSEVAAQIEVDTDGGGVTRYLIEPSPSRGRLRACDSPTDAPALASANADRDNGITV